MSVLNIGLAFLAGLLTVLSPCVLPILPIVFAGASSEHRLGPAALALGVALSFAAAGLFLATIGFSLGIDADTLRPVLGGLLILFGLLLVVPRLQHAFEAALTPLVGWASSKSAANPARGLWAQFGLGALLGAVWSPCVGPTLGAASLLASRGENLFAVALTMMAFGFGAALPLLGIGMVSRTVLMRVRGRLLQTGQFGRWALGGAMLVAGILIASGLDRLLEAELVAISPAWLTNLTTRF